MGAKRRPPILRAVALVLACATGGPVSAALARPASGLRTVRYHGISVRIPRSWPVVDLNRDPHDCVRFDRHALYMGTPSPQESCPAHAVGRTEALLIEPANDGSALGSAGGGLVPDGNASTFVVRSAGVRVTATWSHAPGVVAQPLGRRTLPASRATGSPPKAGPAVTTKPSLAGPIVYTGLGFDTCTAPSSSHMSAWLASPYRAVGIYLGGVNSACLQPNLTARWIRRQIAAGWHVVPTYVGLQAPNNMCGCAGISTNRTEAATQGRAAASHAIARAQQLGIRAGAGNAIYDDMEGYGRGGTNTRAVLAFLAGWTAKLHSYGYVSGVYSGAASGISDLVAKYGTRYREPDDIHIADWNGQKTARDPYVPSGDWTHHRRLHQYLGNRTETYDHVTLNVDDDYLNGATAR